LDTNIFKENLLKVKKFFERKIKIKFTDFCF